MGGGQVLVAYGSQAGCAQSIAEVREGAWGPRLWHAGRQRALTSLALRAQRLHESALKEGYDAILSPLNDYYDKV